MAAGTKRSRKKYEGEDGDPIHPSAETVKAAEGEAAFESFKKQHGTVTDLARSQGNEKQYEDALKPVFDSVLGLVQIVTAGDPRKVKHLMRDPSMFFERLIEDEAGLLRGFLMSRAMHEVVTRPSRKDPLEWAKFMMDVMAHSKENRVQLVEKANEEKRQNGAKREASDVVDELLSRVGRPREGTPGD